MLKRYLASAQVGRLFLGRDIVWLRRMITYKQEGDI